MPAPKPELSDIHRGIERFKDTTDRPWIHTPNNIDWYISHKNGLYPLKYIFALAMNVPPASYTTDQMKSAMKHLKLDFHSLKAESETERQFHEQVKNSLTDPEARRSRLRKAQSQPKVSHTYQIVFQRNPDVVAEVLERANGICESCNMPAPFNRSSNGTPYLEVHHITFLADGGRDTVDNAEALCPNCHRRKHHG